MRAFENEKQKWDKCYASTHLFEEDQVTKEFNEELREYEGIVNIIRLEE